MRTLATLILVMLALATIQVAAFSPPLTMREQNRQILLAERQGTYDPNSVQIVLEGTPAAPVTYVVTGADALEAQLDFLERNGMSLLEHAAAINTGSPAWPLVGEIEFHERGWQDGVGEDAQCPVIQPQVQAVHDFYRSVAGTNEDIGFYESRISEFWLNDVNKKQTSSMKFRPPTGGEHRHTYGGAINEGWTILAGFTITDADNDPSDFFCVEPENGLGVVELDAIIRPVADRTDN